MPLFNAEAVLDLVEAFRVVWLHGRPGGGKTALAFYLAHHLLKTGYCKYLVSNCPSVWNDDPWAIEPDENDQLNAVVVIDEAGLIFDVGKDAEAFVTFMRKLNIVVILPSYEEVPPRLRRLRIQRTATYTPFGLPLWQYAVNLKFSEMRDRYVFWWLNPSEIFGIYNTRAKPMDDAGIGDWIKYWVNEMRLKEEVEDVGKQHLREQTARIKAGGVPKRVPKMENVGGDVGIASAAASFAEAAEQIEDSVSVLERTSRKRRRG